MHAEAVFRRGADAQGDVQPGRYRQAFQTLRQLVRFQPGQLRIPEHVSASGKADQRVPERLDDALVVLFFLVGRVDQHQRPTGGRRQQRLESGEAVSRRNDDLPTRRLKVVAQQAGVPAV